MKLSVLLLIISFAFMSWGSASANSSEPLVYQHNFEYLGAFKLPHGDYGAPLWTGFAYSGSLLAYNDSSLYIGSTGLYAEVSIPLPVINTSVSELNEATVLQNFTDLSEGNYSYIGINRTAIGSTVNIGGVLRVEDQIIGTAYAFYDTQKEAVLSHYTSSLNFSETNESTGMWQVGTPPLVPNPGYSSSFMTLIPPSLRTLLNGTALTGNACLSVISRTSWGPAAFAFRPENLSTDVPLHATPLVYYTESHNTLSSDYQDENIYFNGNTKISGMVMINGSRSVLFFGIHGLGDSEYGYHKWLAPWGDICSAPDVCELGFNGAGWPICTNHSECTTGRKGLPNDPQCFGSGSDGCYFDPTGIGSKGPHAYPYLFQVWAYDANDLAKVANGTLDPWDPVPYAVWNFPWDVAPGVGFAVGAAYDSSTNRLYVAEPKYDMNKYPIIHIYQINFTAPHNTSYQVGGQVILLNGTLKLLNNGTDLLTITETDRTVLHKFNFSTKVNNSDSYNITIDANPSGQKCTVLHGTGTVYAYGDVSNIVVYCNDDIDGAPILQTPLDTATNCDTNVTFICQRSTVDQKNITLWTNTSGTWSEMYSTNTTFIMNTTIDTIANGTYCWNCVACDTDDNCITSTTNSTFTVGPLTAFSAMHNSAYFNDTSPIINTVNSTSYHFWNKTVISSDTQCTFNIGVTI